MDAERFEEETELLNDLRGRLTDYDKHRGQLIPILQMVQQELSYLPDEAIRIVAAHLDIPLSEVYGVATFYNQFRFTPPGKYPFKICLGTACPEDREFSIERVACVGCCAIAPVALLGEVVHGHMAPSKVEGLFTRIQVEKEIAERKKQQDEADQ